jgi:hypothetical protein
MRETTTAAQDEVVQICQDLIRIDTSNFGDGSGPGEAEAAAYVVQSLREVGLEPQTFESDPGRVSVVVRIPGADRERGALCIHGHLDVVPANAADWSVDPFSGELRDGCVWGRGAVDMKDMDAMILAVSATSPAPAPCRRATSSSSSSPTRRPAGARVRTWVEQHPELFDGVTEAISEVGGYSVTVTDRHGDERRPTCCRRPRRASAGFA